MYIIFKNTNGGWGSSLKRELIPIKTLKTQAKGRRATSYLGNSGFILQT